MERDRNIHKRNAENEPNMENTMFGLILLTNNSDYTLLAENETKSFGVNLTTTVYRYIFFMYSKEAWNSKRIIFNDSMVFALVEKSHGIIYEMELFRRKTYNLLSNYWQTSNGISQ